MLKVIYIRPDNLTLNNTNNICKTINQYTTDVFNNFKANQVSNLKKAYYMFIGILINKHNITYTNDNTTLTKINKLVNLNDKNYFTKKIEHTSRTTNNVTRHNHNNY